MNEIFVYQIIIERSNVAKLSMNIYVKKGRWKDGNICYKLFNFMNLNTACSNLLKCFTFSKTQNFNNYGNVGM